MKKINLVFGLLFLYLLASARNGRLSNDSITWNIDSGSFPIKTYFKVLAWILSEDQTTCITLRQSRDTEGKITYLISEEHSEPPFAKWLPLFIHYSPNKNHCGFFYSFHKSYDHKPLEGEIYDILAEWHFNFENKWPGNQCGIDKKLWFDIFGFIPDEHFKPIRPFDIHQEFKILITRINSTKFPQDLSIKNKDFALSKGRIKRIIHNSVPLSLYAKHLVFSRIPEKISGQIEQNGKIFDFEINAGSWLVIRTSNSAQYFGYYERKYRKSFLSPPN